MSDLTSALDLDAFAGGHSTNEVLTQSTPTGNLTPLSVMIDDARRLGADVDNLPPLGSPALFPSTPVDVSQFQPLMTTPEKQALFNQQSFPLTPQSSTALSLQPTTSGDFQLAAAPSLSNLGSAQNSPVRSLARNLLLLFLLFVCLFSCSICAQAQTIFPATNGSMSMLLTPLTNVVSPLPLSPFLELSGPPLKRIFTPSTPSPPPRHNNNNNNSHRHQSRISSSTIHKQRRHPSLSQTLACQSLASQRLVRQRNADKNQKQPESAEVCRSFVCLLASIVTERKEKETKEKELEAKAAHYSMFAHVNSSCLQYAPMSDWSTATIAQRLNAQLDVALSQQSKQLENVQAAFYSSTDDPLDHKTVTAIIRDSDSPVRFDASVFGDMSVSATNAVKQASSLETSISHVVNAFAQLPRGGVNVSEGDKHIIVNMLSDINIQQTTHLILAISGPDFVYRFHGLRMGLIGRCVDYLVQVLFER